nr:hypothetical protein CFP56_69514 [Quercus suber]
MALILPSAAHRLQSDLNAIQPDHATTRPSSPPEHSALNSAIRDSGTTNKLYTRTSQQPRNRNLAGGSLSVDATLYHYDSGRVEPRSLKRIAANTVWRRLRRRQKRAQGSCERSPSSQEKDSVGTA